MPGGAAPHGWGYRPHLDALRVVAVYLVVAYHAGVGRLAHGYVGVDVFFVLSGYLVTTLLLRGLHGPEGRVGFGAFYARRARRLLPAAAVNLIATALVFGAIASPIEFDAAADGIRAAALYVANWFFIRESADYFAADVAANPVIQYWSLSVEEQFYLLWPLGLTGLAALARRAGRRSTRVLQGLVAAGALASAAWALHLASSNLDRAYYGTDTRAYQLLAGALIALAPGIIVRVHRLVPGWALAACTVALIAGISLLATTVVDFGPVSRGVIVTIATWTLLVVMEAAPGRGVVRTVMSWPPLTYLGKISYGTYLWHWLVIVVLVRETGLGPVPILAITAVCATGIASLSYQVLEHPIRAADLLERHRPAVLGVAVVTSLLVGLVIGPGVLDRSSGPATDTAAAPTAAVEAGDSVDSDQVMAAFNDVFRYEDCETSGPIACPRTEGGGRRAIVVGESHAGVLTPMLEDVARRHDLTLSAGFLSFCPWVRGIRYQAAGRECFDDQADLYDRILPEFDPDIVFLAHRPVDDPADLMGIVDADEGRLEGGSPAAAEALDRRVRETIESLRADGRTVVVFEPVPVVAKEDDTLACLSQVALGNTTTAACRFVASPGPLGEEATLRDLAADDEGVIVVDLDPLVCPYLPICDPLVDGEIVHRDANHLTVSYATSLADDVDGYLKAKGLWD